MTKRAKAMPFTKATPGDGGVPEGRSAGDRNLPGGRHNGALLSDPGGTLDRLEERQRATRRGSGVSRKDAGFLGETE
jgi:hypothetical protein